MRPSSAPWPRRSSSHGGDRRRPRSARRSASVGWRVMRADRPAARGALDDAAETTLAIDVGATRTRLAIVRDGAIVRRVTRLTAELADGDGGGGPRLRAAPRGLVRGEPGGRAGAGGGGGGG